MPGRHQPLQGEYPCRDPLLCKVSLLVWYSTIWYCQFHGKYTINFTLFTVVRTGRIKRGIQLLQLSPCVLEIQVNKILIKNEDSFNHYSQDPRQVNQLSMIQTQSQFGDHQECFLLESQRFQQNWKPLISWSRGAQAVLISSWSTIQIWKEPKLSSNVTLLLTLEKATLQPGQTVNWNSLSNFTLPTGVTSSVTRWAPMML